MQGCRPAQGWERVPEPVPERAQHDGAPWIPPEEPEPDPAPEPVTGRWREAGRTA